MVTQPISAIDHLGITAKFLMISGDIDPSACRNRQYFLDSISDPDIACVNWVRCMRKLKLLIMILPVEGSNNRARQHYCAIFRGQIQITVRKSGIHRDLYSVTA
jgi:hypothetical protein